MSDSDYRRCQSHINFVVGSLRNKTEPANEKIENLIDLCKTKKTDEDYMDCNELYPTLKTIKADIEDRKAEKMPDSVIIGRGGYERQLRRLLPWSDRQKLWRDDNRDGIFTLGLWCLGGYSGYTIASANCHWRWKLVMFPCWIGVSCIWIDTIKDRR